MTIYLPPGTPPDLVQQDARAPMPWTAWAAKRLRHWGRVILRRWLDWLDRRAGWVPGPDGRLVPPPQPLVPPQYLLLLGQRHLRYHRAPKPGLARRVWAALFNRD